jgi:hypothetical protein
MSETQSQSQANAIPESPGQLISRLRQIGGLRKAHAAEIKKLNAEQLEVSRRLDAIVPMGSQMHVRPYSFASTVYLVSRCDGSDLIYVDDVAVTDMEKLGWPTAPGDLIDVEFEETLPPAEDRRQTTLPDAIAVARGSSEPPAQRIAFASEAPPAVDDRGQPTRPDEPDEPEEGTAGAAVPTPNGSPYFDDHLPPSPALLGLAAEPESTEPDAAFTVVTESDTEAL